MGRLTAFSCTYLTLHCCAFYTTHFCISAMQRHADGDCPAFHSTQRCKHINMLQSQALTCLSRLAGKPRCRLRLQAREAQPEGVQDLPCCRDADGKGRLQGQARPRKPGLGLVPTGQPGASRSASCGEDPGRRAHARSQSSLWTGLTAVQALQQPLMPANPPSARISSERFLLSAGFCC